MLAIPPQLCRELRFGVLPGHMKSTVPRCLFGRPDKKESRNLLHEVMDAEWVRFEYHWGINPRTETRTNIIVFRPLPRRSPRSKRRVSPYSKQTSMHDYWRVTKGSDPSKKPVFNLFDEILKHQQYPQEQPEQQYPQEQPEQQYPQQQPEQQHPQQQPEEQHPQQQPEQQHPQQQPEQQHPQQQPQQQMEAQPQQQTQAQPQLQPHPQPLAQSQSLSHSNTQTQTQAESETQTQVEPETQTQTEPQTEALPNIIDKMQPLSD